MKTIKKNNIINYNNIPSGDGINIGIVVSEWNNEITENLYQGAISILKKSNCTNFIRKNVPGSFELPLGAQYLLEYKNIDAVICLGSIIQGETKHFDFVCQGTAFGIQNVSLKYNKPVIFGVLTDKTIQQAIDRSGGKYGNKGEEAAITAIKMTILQKEIQQKNPKK